FPRPSNYSILVRLLGKEKRNASIHLPATRHTWVLQQTEPSGNSGRHREVQEVGAIHAREKQARGWTEARGWDRKGHAWPNDHGWAIRRKQRGDRRLLYRRREGLRGSGIARQDVPA